MTQRSHSTEFDIALRKGETAEDGFVALMGVHDARGPSVTFEVKADDKARETGRACFEFWQLDHATSKLKPSGLGVSASDYWAHRIYGGTYDGWWVLAPTEPLRRVVVAYQRANGPMTARDMPLVGDNGNRGILMPLTELIVPWKWLYESRMAEARVSRRETKQ